MSNPLPKLTDAAKRAWNTVTEPFLEMGDDAARRITYSSNMAFDWLFEKEQTLIDVSKSAANDMALFAPKSPDPLTATAEFLSYSSVRTGQGLNFLRKEFPGKTFAVIAIPGNAAIFQQGINTDNDALKVAGGLFALSNLAVLMFSDQTKEEGALDPQDIEQSALYWTNAKRYPHEFATTTGTLGGLVSQTASVMDTASGDQTGHMLMGGVGLLAFIISHIREKPEATEQFKDIEIQIPGTEQTIVLDDFLNQNGVKKIINTLETRPLMAAGLLYQLGVVLLFSHDYAQAEFALSNMQPEVLQTTAAATLANSFYIWAKKRQKDDDTPTLNTHDITPE